MATITIYDQTKKEVGSMDLAPEVFEVPVKPEILHLVVRSQLAAKRQGTHATKTRGMKRGGGAKPWRQKGTGRARAGSTRSPLWRGGGTVFGPQPRDYSFKVNKKGPPSCSQDGSHFQIQRRKDDGCEEHRPSRNQD